MRLPSMNPSSSPRWIWSICFQIRDSSGSVRRRQDGRAGGSVHSRALEGAGRGGGLYASYNSTVSVLDSIIWGNISRYDGTQVGVASGDESYPLPSKVDIRYSIVEPDVNEIQTLLRNLGIDKKIEIDIEN